VSKILLVEDDETLCDLIGEYLKDAGFDVCVCSDAQSAADLAYEQKFDLFIFDVKIPKGDGFSLLKELRKNGDHTPAIFATSLNTLDDLEVGFKSGCDDYLKKPYELKELLLRVNSLIKRNFSHNFDDFVTIDDEFKFYFASKELRRSGVPVALSNKERELLALFLQNKNRLLSKDEIFSAIYTFDETPSEEALRTYIKNLRRVLGESRIVNRRNAGYLYV